MWNKFIDWLMSRLIPLPKELPCPEHRRLTNRQRRARRRARLRKMAAGLVLLACCVVVGHAWGAL